jgi:hypothetical protein
VGDGDRQRKRQFQLVAQQRQHAAGAALTTCRQPPERGPADEDRVGAQRQGYGNVGAAADAPVDEDGGTSLDRVHYLGQRVGAGEHAVELAPTVIGDDHPGRPVLDRQRRVLGGENSLDQNGQFALGSKLLQVPPAQCRVHQRECLLDRHLAVDPQGGLHARHPEALGNAEPRPQVPLSTSAPGRVDGDEDRLEAGLDRLVHQRPRHRLVPDAVELEPAPTAWRPRGNLARPHGSQSRKAHHRPAAAATRAIPTSPSGSTSR